MLNFEKGRDYWLIVIQYTISSNNMRSFFIHSIISYEFPFFHLSFTLSLLVFHSDFFFPQRLINSLTISHYSSQVLNAHFHNFTHNFGLIQVQSHQMTMVHNFTFTQSKQENNSIKLLAIQYKLYLEQTLCFMTKQ